MAEFSELIKNFNKIRDFMRDFYIYGFKSRDEYFVKSLRTYDNEKRRCESYLGEHFQWKYYSGKKVSFVSADCHKLTTNPLFSAWKSKSFTDNDIILHFHILHALQQHDMSVEQLADYISTHSGTIFDTQTVRGKCNEYTDLGVLTKQKTGKAFRYQLTTDTVSLDDNLLDAIKFFQCLSLGVIGDYILDKQNATNDLFLFKHHSIAHTLDDGVLYDILTAIHQRKSIQIVTVGSKSGMETTARVVPLKILCSYWSGRRYLCAYMLQGKRFSSLRLDSIKSITMLTPAEDYALIQSNFERTLDKVWGVSFESQACTTTGFSMTIHIDEEHEQYIIRRINKEGRGGTLERLSPNTFKFSKDVLDANEALPWVKTFIGRIISFNAADHLEKKFHTDIRRMAIMYDIGGEE